MNRQNLANMIPNYLNQLIRGKIGCQLGDNSLPCKTTCTLWTLTGVFAPCIVIDVQDCCYLYAHVCIPVIRQGTGLPVP